MAVYTKVTKSDLHKLLNNYEIGNLISYEGIAEGVENTNYKITTSKSSFILTIFEKRVMLKDIPFFIDLMVHLSSKNFKCPEPISDKEGVYIQKINKKLGIIVSFIEGRWVKKVQNIHCQQLGDQLAKLHIATEDFPAFRHNNMGYKNWKSFFDNFKLNKIEKYSEIYKIIEKELEYLIDQWPKQLNTGVIHADLFRDNVFFYNDKFTGIIDFYFACNDYYAYELAVCLNAWCFERDQSFNTTKARKILNSYQKKRPLNKDEKHFFPILSRGAALRFLLTRLNDLIFHPKDVFLTPKDPVEFINILSFHQKIKSINEYGLED